MSQRIYKICPRAEWESAVQNGVYLGAPVDLADGFIHFSRAEQVRETAAKHFAGQDDLVLLAFDAATLGEALKWEESRGGDLFPHLYAEELPVDLVQAEFRLPLGDDGTHQFPSEL